MLLTTLMLTSVLVLNNESTAHSERISNVDVVNIETGRACQSADQRPISEEISGRCSRIIEATVIAHATDAGVRLDIIV